MTKSCNGTKVGESTLLIFADRTVAFGVEEVKDEKYWDGIAKCYNMGLIKNVGVSLIYSPYLYNFWNIKYQILLFLF